MTGRLESKLEYVNQVLSLPDMCFEHQQRSSYVTVSLSRSYPIFGFLGGYALDHCFNHWHMLTSGKACLSLPMFPLNCARARTHTSHETNTHTRKLGARTNIPSKNVFANVSYTFFLMQTSPGEILHERNFMCTLALKN